MATANNEFKLIGPSGTEKYHHPAVTLSCRLSPEISAVNMEIRWFKKTDCVCVYKNRQVTEGRRYEGRVSLFTQELERGNVSLQLRDCIWLDEGHYLCQVTDGDRTEEITVWMEWVLRQLTGDPQRREERDIEVIQFDRKWTEDERMKMKVSALQTELEETERRLTERDTQLMERDKLIKPNKLLHEKVRLLEEKTEQLQEQTDPESSAPIRRRNSKEELYPHNTEAASSKSDATDRSRLTMTTCADFMDQHRADLIQKISSVMEIADHLISKKLITDEMYNTMNVPLLTSEQQMRLLYKVLNSGGKAVKQEAYKIIRKKMPGLVDDLESGSSSE